MFIILFNTKFTFFFYYFLSLLPHDVHLHDGASCTHFTFFHMNMDAKINFETAFNEAFVNSMLVKKKQTEKKMEKNKWKNSFGLNWIKESLFAKNPIELCVGICKAWWPKLFCHWKDTTNETNVMSNNEMSWPLLQMWIYVVW